MVAGRTPPARASKPLAINSTLKLMNKPLGVPINVMKIKNNGNTIWVDAVDTIDIARASKPHLSPALHARTCNVTKRC
jgi:hypothetical protein